jgi:hypothetical protein
MFMSVLIVSVQALIAFYRIDCEIIDFQSNRRTDGNFEGQQNSFIIYMYKFCW